MAKTERKLFSNPKSGEIWGFISKLQIKYFPKE